MVTLERPLRFATLNARELSARRRQNQLYRLVTEQDLDIVAVQETKVESAEQTDVMVRSFTASVSATRWGRRRGVFGLFVIV